MIKLSKNILGFTLIELLVVISIIGILATLVSANLNSARSRARDAARKSDLKNISTALRIYANDNNGVFPASITWNSKWTNVDGNTTYMELVPNDPLNDPTDSGSPTYVYEIGSPPDTFTLTACLENASDKQGKTADASYNCSSGTMYQVKQ